MFTTAKEAPSSLFSSLPDDVVLNVLARVPRRYPILSCVSKKLRSLLRSSEFQMTRSLLGKDSFYVCLGEYGRYCHLTSGHWFTFTENRRCLELVSISFPFPVDYFDEHKHYSAILTVGPEIYFLGKSKSMWILDSRSGKLRQGPSSLVATHEPAMGLVNEKIYIFGGLFPKDIEAQVFDLETQTWQVAPYPSVKFQCQNKSVVTPSLGRKIYVMGTQGIIIYDTRDGKCEKIRSAEDYNTGNMCMVDDVIYMYIHDVGLMWYESKDKEWRVVHGLKFNGCFNTIKMAEHNGKLALLWHDEIKRKIWCAMIAFSGSIKVAIRGSVEWSDCLLSDVPSNYYINHFIMVSTL